jgi:hypothetical protein
MLQVFHGKPGSQESQGGEDRDKGQGGTREGAEWVYFPNSLKEAHSYLEQKSEGIHPELLGKEEGEAEGWEKGELPGSTHEGLLVIPAVQFDPA